MAESNGGDRETWRTRRSSDGLMWQFLLGTTFGTYLGLGSRFWGALLSWFSFKKIPSTRWFKSWPFYFPTFGRSLFPTFQRVTWTHHLFHRPKKVTFTRRIARFRLAQKKAGFLMLFLVQDSFLTGLLTFRVGRWSLDFMVCCKLPSEFSRAFK